MTVSQLRISTSCDIKIFLARVHVCVHVTTDHVIEIRMFTIVFTRSPLSTIVLFL